MGYFIFLHIIFRLKINPELFLEVSKRINHLDIILINIKWVTKLCNLPVSLRLPS
jgi:hypothetical protein